ncbi:MAG TPA: PAS domain S-box protein [Mesorhizobium sp.]|jgi:PAS domain S-box-containing protein|nr:PAS domain S-box protein [Mesorhizobium sp.]
MEHATQRTAGSPSGDVRSAEEAQTRSEVRLRQVQEAARIGTFEFDRVANKAAASPEYLELYGLPPAALESFDYETWLALVHPDDRGRIEAETKSAITDPSCHQLDYEFRIRRADTGETRWVAARTKLERDGAGRFIQSLGAQWDVTDERRALAALQESEIRFRNMADHAPVMMWMSDPSGRCTYLNQRWYEYTAATEEQALGFGWMTMLHPEDRARLERKFEEENDQPRAYQVEFRMRRADGQYRWVLDAASPRFGPDGEFLGFIGSVIDIDERKEAEEALRRSETRLAAVLSQASAGIAMTDVEGRFTFVNDHYCAMLGRTREELLATKMQAVTDPDDLIANIPLFKAAVAGGPPFEIEKRYLRPDGSPVWVRNSVTAIRDVQGAFQAILAVSIDISDRKAAEAAAQASERALQELNRGLEQRVAERTAERDRIWQLSPDLMLVARTDGTIVSANPAWDRLLGWSAEWLAGRNAAEIKHPDDAVRTAAELKRLAAGGYSTSNFEDRYRHHDGSWRWISWVCEPEGELIYCIGRDITAEKAHQANLVAAEAARREADALYRAYFQNTAEALFVANVLEDGGFTVEDLNPAHQASIGLPLAEVYGKRLDEILPPGAVELVQEHYRRVLERGEVYQYRETFELQGEPTHWDTVLVPVRDSDGRIVRIIGSSRDLTRQVSAEEQLRQAQKMDAMGQLTGGVAHDFNNLLTPIIGSLDMLRRRGIGSEREQRMIGGALESAERAKTLVQRLLAFARRQPLQPVAVDLDVLITNMAGLIGSTLGPQIEVRVDIGDDLPPAHGDANQLEMALLNLAVNARDAMPDGGTLTIAAAHGRGRRGNELGLEPGNYIRLSVSDTGIGMDEAVLKRAVEPFYSTKGVGRGTGLGLSMVHGLAAQLGGGLHILSAPGRGTVVELWLPVSAEQLDSAGAAGTHSPEPKGRGRVLLVDDEELVRMSTADMLIDLGYEVVEAGSAEEALRMVQAGIPFDLLVTDHLMPSMSGAELAREARKLRPGVPLLIISGYADVEGIAPDLPRLTKPFRNADLATMLACLSEPYAPPQ